MEAKEYLRELVRMFDSLRGDCFKGESSCRGIACEKCPLEIGTGCVRLLPESVDIVERWRKEHPIKTIKDDFLEKFPNAEKYDDGRPCLCVRRLGYKVECECKAGGCHDCWNTPLEVE